MTEEDEMKLTNAEIAYEDYNEHAYDTFIGDHSDIAEYQPTKNAGITLLGLTDV